VIAVFAKSVRWRLQAWLALLLAAVLAGFGGTVYQLQRVRQLGAIDDELDRRAGVVAEALHPPPPKGMRFGPRPDHDDSRDPSARRDEPRGEGGMGPRGGGGGEPPGQIPGAPGEKGDPTKRDDRPEWHFPGGPGGGGPRGPFPPSAQLLAMLQEVPTNGNYAAVWYANGTLLDATPGITPGLGWPRGVAPRGQTTHRTRADYREAVHATEFGDVVVAGCPLAPHYSSMRRFVWLLFLAGGGVLMAGLAGSWWMSGRAIRPIEQISAAAGRISAGNLAERITTEEPENELGRLAAVLNSTFARLEAAFIQQREFVSDASHELRTPLAVLISEAQSTLARERTAAEYRETVEACLQTAQQMRRLADSLLLLARLDSGETPLARKEFELGPLVDECVEFIRPLGRAKSLTIIQEVGDVRAFGDPDRIRQVIVNLLSNATQYNRQNGEIRVTARGEGTRVSLTVADTGEGIPAESLARLGERFYRVDKSRSRNQGGAGLGLAISKAIVDAHGGTLRITSTPGAGSAFTIELPRPEGSARL